MFMTAMVVQTAVLAVQDFEVGEFWGEPEQQTQWSKTLSQK
jgi:hypothetical protein